MDDYLFDPSTAGHLIKQIGLVNTWVHIRPFEYKFSTGIDEYYLFESSTAGHLIKQISLGKYIEDKVPSLKHFMIEENNGYKHSIPSLAALVRSKRLLQRFWSCDEPQLKFCRANWLWYIIVLNEWSLSSFLLPICRHEFKINHGEWVGSYKSHLGPGTSERILEYIRDATDENTDLSRSIQIELREALGALLEVFSLSHPYNLLNS